MTSLKKVATILEFAGVDARPQNLVKRRDRNLAFALAKSEPLRIRFLRQGFDRILPRCKPTKQAGNDGSQNWIRYDYTLPRGIGRVEVPEWRE